MTSSDPLHSDRLPFDLVAQRLASRIDELVSRLLPNAVYDPPHARNPPRYKVGSIRGEPGGSMVIWRTGHKQGEWFDAAARGVKGEAGGDALHLVRAVLNLQDIVAAKRWALEFLNLKEQDPRERERLRRAVEEGRKLQERRAIERESDRKKLAGLALKHFIGAKPIMGTPAEAYLRGRGIDLAMLEHEPGALRFAMMRCPESRDAMMRPCMLAAVYRPHEGARAEFMTVHRIFLAELAGGRVVKASHPEAPAPMVEAKQAYCDFHGGFVSAWRGDSSKPVAQMPPEWVICCEGIEDALSWPMADPSLRVFATVTLGNLAKIVFPKNVQGVFWHRHQGDPPEAQAALRSAIEAQASRGVPVKILDAPGGHKDVNEWLMAQAGQE